MPASASISEPGFRAAVRVAPGRWARLARVVALTLCSSGALVLVAVGSNDRAADVIGLTLFVMGTVGAYSWLGRTRRLLASARVSVEDGELFADGRRLAAREEIVSGIVEATPSGALLRLTRRNQVALIVELPDADAGRSIAAAMALDSARRPAIVTVPAHDPSKLTVSVALVLGVFLLVHTLGAGPLGVGAMIAAVGLFVALLERTNTLTIGADGLLVTGFRHRGFVALADVVQVEELPEAVRLSFGNATTCEIYVGGRQKGAIASIAGRIHELMQSPESPEGVAELLDRDGRSDEAWISDLRALPNAKRFRERPISTEEIWRVVGDARASLIHRAAAAVALSSALDREGAARLITLAGASATAELRTALEAAADDRPAEELAAALVAVEGFRAAAQILLDRDRILAG